MSDKDRSVEELADEFASMFPEIQEEWAELATQTSVLQDAIFYGTRQQQYKQWTDLQAAELQLEKKMAKIRFERTTNA